MAATPLLKGDSEDQLGQPGTGGTKESFGFGFVVIFPLPEDTSEEEEAAFAKQHLQGGRTCDQILDSFVIHGGVREDPETRLHCDNTLKSLRTSTIQMFQSFFETVFKAHETESSEKSTIFTFTSCDCDELYMCVKMSLPAAQALAAMVNYPVQLSKDALPKLGIKITKDLDKVVPAFVSFNKGLRDNGFLKMYPVPGTTDTMSAISPMDRLRILNDKIVTYLNVPEMQRLGSVAAVFPPHNSAPLAKLKKDWATWRKVYTTKQPIDDVRGYFGERIAFYFLFTGFLGFSSAALMLVALPIGGWTMLSMNSPHMNISHLVYALCLVAWFLGYIKCWRRQESMQATIWGTDGSSGSNMQPAVNPKFVGEMAGWPLDENRMVLTADPFKKNMGLVGSAVATILFIITVLAAVLVTNFKAGEMHKANPTGNALQLAAIVLSVEIQVFTQIWNRLAEALTHREEHVTLLAFEQSLNKKIAIMTLVITFFPFFYTAFLQDTFDPETCEAVGGCLFLLRKNLQIIYMTYIMFGIVDMIKPILLLKYSFYAEAKAMKKEGKTPAQLSLLEEQGKMDDYTAADLNGDYMQILFPLGFIVMFSTACPLFLNVLNLLSLLSQMRADAFKLCVTQRRVFPTAVPGVAPAATQILNMYIPLCMIVNIGLLLKYMDLHEFLSFNSALVAKLDSDPSFMKAFLFFVLMLVFMVIKEIMYSIVSDTNPRCLLVQARQRLQRMRLFEQKTTEFNEKIIIQTCGDHEKMTYSEVQPLQPGHKMFVPGVFT